MIKFANEDDSEILLILPINLKSLGGKKYSSFSYRKDLPNDFYSFLTISNFGIGFSVKEDSVNSKNCFVLRKKYQNGYVDTYISKDDYMILRTVEFFENYYYKETNYLIEKNIINNKNVDFSNKDQTEYKNYVKINSNKNN